MWAKSLQSCLTFHDPMNCSSARLLCPWAFSRQEYWSGLPCHPPRDLPNPGIKPTSLMSSALADGVFTISTTWQGHKTGLVRPRFLKVTSYFRFKTYQKNLMFLPSLKNSIENSLSYFCKKQRCITYIPFKGNTLCPVVGNIVSSQPPGVRSFRIGLSWEEMLLCRSHLYRAICIQPSNIYVLT